jgi:hypothetical protein
VVVVKKDILKNRGLGKVKESQASRAYGCKSLEEQKLELAPNSHIRRGTVHRQIDSAGFSPCCLNSSAACTRLPWLDHAHT